MDLGLKNKVALVLASSNGLGRAIAVSLGREGALVAVTGRNAAEIEKTVGEITAVGGKAYGMVWDQK